MPVLHEGKVLDGRHRYRACLDTGIECRFRDFEGDDPHVFVHSENLHRRHLGEGQRAMVAARLVTTKPKGGQPEKNQENSPGSFTIDDAAAAAHTSRKPIQEARRVQEKGVPALREAVESGAVAVSDAAAITKQDKDVQRELVGAVQSGQAKNLKAALKARNRQAKRDSLTPVALPDGRVFHCSCADLAKHVEAAARSCGCAARGRPTATSGWSSASRAPRSAR